MNLCTSASKTFAAVTPFVKNPKTRGSLHSPPATFHTSRTITPRNNSGCMTFLNVFLMWEANNRAQCRCESVSQWHRHAAAAASGGFISIFNNGLFFSPLLSHDPRGDTVHRCPLKAVHKRGQVKWHTVRLRVRVVLQVERQRFWVWFAPSKRARERDVTV